MKDIKAFIIVDFIIFIVKVIGGFITHSFTLMVSGMYDLVLVLCSLVVYKGQKENSNLKVFTILIGILSILSAGGLIAAAWLVDIRKTSLWVLLFIIIALVMRYIVSCFYTNVGYQRKKGLLSYGNIVSNLDFYNYGVVILALVLMKVSKWVSVLKYADRFGVILLSILLIVRGIKLIKNSIVEKDIDISDKILDEVNNRKEVKALGRTDIQYYGGLRVARFDVVLRDDIGMVDVNSFVVTLQDYLLKISDAVRIYLIDRDSYIPKKVKVRSLKQDARNSRSGNSKTGSKKKNPKKTNKKR